MVVPTFDRALDLARAGARVIGREQSIVLVEGNYLLLESDGWEAAAACFDRTLYISVPEAELRRRLVDRWLGYGLEPPAAEARAEGNDMRNARLVARTSRAADVVWTQG